MMPSGRTYFLWGSSAQNWKVAEVTNAADLLQNEVIMGMKTLNKEQLLERGSLPWGNTNPPVYLCAQCLTAEINAGVGLCRTCLKIVDNREAEAQPDDSRVMSNLIIISCVAMIALIVFSLAMNGAR